jgi:NADPH:quinone reductase-like Zn-dependent oxidoreductase
MKAFVVEDGERRKHQSAGQDGPQRRVQAAPEVPNPVVLGHDGTGVATRVGGAVRDFQVGDEVYARPRDLQIGAHVKPGQKVLVHAGSGGLRSTVIQLAKHLGARVATTASGENAKMVCMGDSRTHLRSQDDPNLVATIELRASRDEAEGMLSSPQARNRMERHGVDLTSLQIRCFDEVAAVTR